MKSSTFVAIVNETALNSRMLGKPEIGRLLQCAPRLARNTSMPFKRRSVAEAHNAAVPRVQQLGGNRQRNPTNSWFDPTKSLVWHSYGPNTAVAERRQVCSPSEEVPRRRL